MTDEQSNGENQRDYFRVHGEIFLRVTPCDTPPSAEISTTAGLDLAKLKLLNFQSRLTYNNPPGETYLQDLAEILGHLHETITALQSGRPPVPPLRPTAVVISGSGMTFPSKTPFAPDTLVQIDLGFLEYPFATITVQGQVLRCIPRDNQSGHDVIVTYHEIPEPDREVIIKFVNHLQRQQLKGSDPIL